MRTSFLALIALLGLSSCEKVIEVDLDDTEPQLVLESKLNHDTQELELLISYTAPYFEAGEIVTVDDALVTLESSTGVEWIIPALGNGLYQSIIESEIESDYTLKVEVDGVLYEATSTLKAPVPLVEVYEQFTPATGLFDEGYAVYFRYQDPADDDNYYRVIHSLNGETQLEGDDLITIDDQLNNGSLAQFPIFGKSFESGDSVGVVLIHFDEAGYEYFSSLADIMNTGGGGPNSGSAAPGNPVTNWSGDALGYFSAFTSDTLSIVIP